MPRIVTTQSLLRGGGGIALSTPTTTIIASKRAASSTFLVPQIPAASAAIAPPFCHTNLRSFSSTPKTPRKDVPHPEKIHKPRLLRAGKHIPPYPYGPRQTYKQANSGLYGLATVRYGNIVAEKYGNKTRRRWKPNVHTHRFKSRILGHRLRIRTTARVQRTIKKLGGIDNYLLGCKTRRIRELGVQGWKLRWWLLRRLKREEKLRPERKLDGYGRTRLERMRADLGLSWSTSEEFVKRVEELKAKIRDRKAEDLRTSTLIPSMYSELAVAAEEAYDDPTLEAEVINMLENDHEFEIGEPDELVEPDIGTQKRV